MPPPPTRMRCTLGRAATPAEPAAASRSATMVGTERKTGPALETVRERRQPAHLAPNIIRNRAACLSSNHITGKLLLPTPGGLPAPSLPRCTCNEAGDAVLLNGGQQGGPVKARQEDVASARRQHGQRGAEAANVEEGRSVQVHIGGAVAALQHGVGVGVRISARRWGKGVGCPKHAHTCTAACWH